MTLDFSVLADKKQGGSLFAWSSWRTIVPLALGGTGLLVFVIYEAKVPSFPVIPLTVLYNQTAASAFLGTLVLGVVQFGLLYYLPLYYQVVKGYSPLFSGLALLPQCLLSGPTTAITGVLIAKTGRYRLIVWTGWILLTTGCGVLALLDVKTTAVQWIFINIVSGFGLGALFTSQSVATQAATEDQHKAIVSGLTPFFRTIGQAFGIVVCGTVFQNAFRSRLLDTTSAELHEYSNQLVVNSIMVGDVVDKLKAGTAEREELVYAYNQALHSVWWTLTAFAGAAGVLSLHIQQISLEQPAQQQQEHADPEISASTEPFARLDGQSIRPQASLQTMPSLQHLPALRDQSSVATLNLRRETDTIL